MRFASTSHGDTESRTKMNSSMPQCLLARFSLRGEPPRETPHEFVSVPVLRMHARELKQVGAPPHRSGRARARAGEAGVAHELDGLRRVVTPAAVRVREARHRLPDDLLQARSAGPYLARLLLQGPRRKQRVRHRVRAHL